MPARIEVLKISPINKGNVKAFASVRLGSVTIHDCRIVQQPGQAAWVSMPQREYVNKEGVKKYAAIVELSDNLKAEVSSVVVAAWQQQTDSNEDDLSF